MLMLDPASLDSLASLISERVMRELDVERVDDGCDSPYLNTDGAARYLAGTRQRVYDLVSSGRLRAFKEGGRSLYRREDLDALVQAAWPQRGPT
jgi:excisionase family DNA binding protein